MEGDHRGDATRVTRRKHAPIVFQDGPRELALFRFNARPLQGEAVQVEAQLRQQGDVLWIAMIVVAGIAGGFCEDRLRHMFQQPYITVDVVPFDLMRRRGRSPQKPFWKFQLHGHPVSSSRGK